MVELKEKLEKFRRDYHGILKEAKIVYDDRTVEYDGAKTANEKMLYGIKSLIHEIHYKVERLVSLEAQSENENVFCADFYERVMDTIYDGINFFAFLGVYVQEKYLKLKELDYFIT